MISSLTVWSATMKSAETFPQTASVVDREWYSHSTTTLDKTNEMCVLLSSPFRRRYWCAGNRNKIKVKCASRIRFYFASVFAIAKRTNVNDFKRVILSRKGIKVVACGGVKAMPSVFLYIQKKLIVVSSIKPKLLQQYSMSILKKRNPLVLRTRCEHTPLNVCVYHPHSPAPFTIQTSSINERNMFGKYTTKKMEAVYLQRSARDSKLNYRRVLCAGW